MNWVPPLLVLSALLLCPAQEPVCQDGVCGAPLAAAVETALCPVGISKPAKVKQGARLDSLAGKTIALVGGSFMAHVTHPELKRLILSEFPDARIIMLSEIGSAGPFPGPGVYSERKEAFTRALKERGVHAVIAGNGGCGLCTPKEMGSCIAAESIGIPAVMIAGPGFVVQAQRTAMTAGIPIPRVVEYPGAFASHTREELLENTRRTLWPQIKRALTQPLTPAETKQLPAAAAEPETLSGSYAELSRAFAERGWSDGLPIVPPTEERVAEFLRFTPLAPDELVGTLPVAYREVTVRHVAINGVMAGCRPEYMPILVAFTRAMADGYFRRTLSSTHAWNPYCWLNGPLARQLGFSAEQGEISAPANVALGRFINLAMRNLGGYYCGENRMGTFGYLMPWCLAEDDAAARKLGWQPWHVQQGYGLNENTLTAASALAWGNNLSPATTDPQRIMQLMAQEATEKQQFAIASGTPFVYRTFLVTPAVARDLAKSYRSKDSLENALVDTARMPLEQRAWGNYYANPGSAVRASFERHRSKLADAEHAADSPTPPWLSWCGKKTLLTVPVMQRGKSAILITGDAARNKTMCLPGGGFATIRIDLPDNWDSLVAPLGYAPLKSFYLSTGR